MGWPIPWLNEIIQTEISSGLIRVVGVNGSVALPTDSMQYLSSLTSAIRTNRHVPPGLAVTNALMSCSDFNFTTTSGPFDWLVFFRDTGVDATSPIRYSDFFGVTSGSSVIAGNIARL